MEVPANLPMPDIASLKLDEPPAHSQHVEIIVTDEDGEKLPDAKLAHLPGGIHETDKEKKEGWFIGSIDCGTTSTRFIIFNGEGSPVADHQIEFENFYPQSGWHEQDPYELVSSVEECIEKCTAKFEEKGHNKDQIKAIGLTTQRETTICWDKHTGKTLHRAIVWPDTRTSKVAQELKNRAGQGYWIQQACGLPISTYPSSVKLLWMLDHVDEVKQAYEESRLAFGTVDTWLIYKLNGGTERDIHVTDTSNASRTMFMNIHTLKYDEKLLKFFNLDQEKVKLPTIVPSSCPDSYGSMKNGTLAGVKITGCLGDQSSALVGQCGFKPGEAKNTYGTGCFLLYNVGEKPVISKHGLLATVAYHFAGHPPIYALEGSIAVAGSGVKFLMNNLGFIRDSSKITELAETVEDSGGVVFVTAFSGLFAPYWIGDAQGTLFGITAYTQRGHIARATLEATCFQTKAILDAMEKDSGHKLEGLAVDGGMSNSDLCMQTQADIIGIPVDRPVMRETTALGAAIAAGFAVDIWKEFDDLKEINKEDRKVFEPSIEPKKAAKMFKKWDRAVKMSRGWVDPNDSD